MTKLEQARENYIKLGNKHDQAWDKFDQARDKRDQAWDKYNQAWDKYDQAWYKYKQAWANLLKLEIEHILATKISI